MNESDDDDDSKSEHSGMRSANASDDESTDGTHSGVRCVTVIYSMPYWFFIKLLHSVPLAPLQESGNAYAV
jgi:hypothetical protein